MKIKASGDLKLSDSPGSYLFFSLSQAHQGTMVLVLKVKKLFLLWVSARKMKRRKMSTVYMSLLIFQEK